jgi:protocatechuate 3,4-dioxygenase alpha subunit
MSKITTSQTIGPFSHEAWQWAVDLAPGAGAGAGANAITIAGVIYDGQGAPINDAQIEAWIPFAAGAESDQPMPGFRRVPSDDDGNFSLCVPRAAAATAGEPLVYVCVFARGLVKHQFSAIFLDDAAGLAESSLLNQVPAARRATLVARKVSDSEYRWDIRLQGDQETVFFDYM